MCWTPDRAIRFRAMAGVIPLCSGQDNSTLTVRLSTQVYKLGTGKRNAVGNPAVD